MVDFGGILAGALGAGANEYLEESKRAAEAKRKANLQRLADLGVEVRQEKQNIYNEGQTEKQREWESQATDKANEFKTKSDWGKLPSGMYDGSRQVTNAEVEKMTPEEFNNLRDQTGYDNMVSKKATEAERSKRDWEKEKIGLEGEQKIKAVEAKNGLLGGRKYNKDEEIALETQAERTLGMFVRSAGGEVIRSTTFDIYGDQVQDPKGRIESVLIPMKSEEIDPSIIARFYNLGYDASGKIVNKEDGKYYEIQIGSFNKDNVNKYAVGTGADLSKFDNNGGETIGEPLDAKAALEPVTTEPLDAQGAIKDAKSPILGEKKDKIPTLKEVKAAIKRLSPVGKDTMAGKVAGIAGKAQAAVKEAFTETKAKQIPYTTEIDGKQVEIPLMVPGTNMPTKAHLRAGKPPTEQMINRAIKYAKERKKKGLPYFRGNE